ncbi:hypothetical protein B9G69_015025 [Bdellovibrio sp. SKB1291214]|uniref:hypothetical protein n=1 Tax=Bdellovibrio sp. SKB1291214 TaxID=1732569 RepID=UPI000B518238|nr:hypothetical protein [Bdellovibrio sp. SKB1291214]UYL08353.1 hypothetical protein B9G69_015025 [Bdellovibrio sp. SKB1291214]
MNIKQHVTISLIISMTSLFSSTGFAEEQAPITLPTETISAPAAPEKPAEPVTGYQGMLPYIQENAAIRKEAKKKYGPERSAKKSKKSKVKSASKKKSRTSASVKKSGKSSKKVSTKNKKSPSKR